MHEFRYPFVVRNPPTTEKKLKKLKSVKSVASSSVKLRDLMENMTDDEIIDEVIYFCTYIMCINVTLVSEFEGADRM